VRGAWYCPHPAHVRFGTRALRWQPGGVSRMRAGSIPTVVLVLATIALGVSPARAAKAPVPSASRFT
jgi:hypothetical protein